MRQADTIRWLDVVRPFSLGALLVALVVLLASCSAGSILKDSDNAPPSGKTVPPVALQQITGVPPGKLGELTTAMSIAGGQYDIGFIQGTMQSGTFSLAGQFKATSGSAGVQIVYQWQFRDAEGVLIQTIDGDDNAGLYSGSDPWSAVSPSVMDRIARRTAETMAQQLNRMGYATRLTRLTVPPAEYFAMASPEAAHREIDFETLNGPGMAGAGMDMIATAVPELPPEEPELQRAAVDPIPGETALARAVNAPDEPYAAPPPDEPGYDVAEAPAAPEPKPGKQVKQDGKTSKAKPGQQEIRAVAVMQVEGSPGSGDQELTAALRKTLIDAGWPVVSRPQPDALTIVGRVKVAAKGNAEAVSVRWVVKSPDGKTLGDVKQANNVPRGALDAAWGPAAFAVAEAAATGIFDIVQRYQ